MAFRAALLLAIVLSPLAAAEGLDLRVAGASVGMQRGLAGFQWDDEGAVGMRYWVNGTEGDEASILVTTCATTDSHLVWYCERHVLAP